MRDIVRLIGYLDSIKISNKCLLEKYQRVILSLPEVELQMREKIDFVIEETREVIIPSALN